MRRHERAAVEDGLDHDEGAVDGCLDEDALPAEYAGGVEVACRRVEIGGAGHVADTGGGGADGELHERRQAAPRPELGAARHHRGPRLGETEPRQRGEGRHLVLDPAEGRERRHRRSDSGAGQRSGVGGEDRHLLLGGEQDVVAVVADHRHGRRQPAQGIASVGGDAMHPAYVTGEAGEAQRVGRHDAHGVPRTRELRRDLARRQARAVREQDAHA